MQGSSWVKDRVTIQDRGTARDLCRSWDRQQRFLQVEGSKTMCVAARPYVARPYRERQRLMNLSVYLKKHMPDIDWTSFVIASIAWSRPRSPSLFVARLRCSGICRVYWGDVGIMALRRLGRLRLIVSRYWLVIALFRAHRSVFHFSGWQAPRPSFFLGARSLEETGDRAVPLTGRQSFVHTGCVYNTS